MTKALIQLGQVEDAESLLAIDSDQGDPVAMVRLATLHERTNRVDSASSLLSRAMEQSGDTTDTDAERLSLEAALAMRDKDYVRAQDATRTLLQLDKLPPPARVNAHFVMARIADKHGHTAEAMSELAAAHAIRFDLASDMLPEIAESPDEPLRIASKWLSAEQAAFPASANAPSRDASPIFIMGFPRSGTTMLEQMLDARPATFRWTSAYPPNWSNEWSRRG